MFSSHTETDVWLSISCVIFWIRTVWLDREKPSDMLNNQPHCFKWNAERCNLSIHSSTELLILSPVACKHDFAFVCFHVFRSVMWFYCFCRAAVVTLRSSRPDAFTPRLSPSSVNYPQSPSRSALISSEEFPSMKAHQITSSLKRYSEQMGWDPSWKCFPWKRVQK